MNPNPTQDIFEVNVFSKSREKKILFFPRAEGGSSVSDTDPFGSFHFGQPDPDMGSKKSA